MRRELLTVVTAWGTLLRFAVSARCYRLWFSELPLHNLRLRCFVCLKFICRFAEFPDVCISP